MFDLLINDNPNASLNSLLIVLSFFRPLTENSAFLKLSSIDYKYCMVIEYNTHPVVKGKGSAIFFHVADEKYSPTAGCVAIAEKDMLQFLKWFKPKKKKAMLSFGIVEVFE